jgi:hypothetical protein
LEADDDITINASVVASDLITVSAGQDGTGGISLNVAGSLETTDAGSDVVLSAGSSSGDIDLVGTTTAVDQVSITAVAGSINGAGQVTGDTVDLVASSGIGNSVALETAAAVISADATSGNIEIDNVLGTPVDVTLLRTGSGSVQFNQSGGGDLVAGTVVASDLVTLVNVAGDIALAGSVVGCGFFWCCHRWC